MTKAELTRQLANFLISHGASQAQAKAYAEGFPRQFTADTMIRMKDVNDWDMQSKGRVLASFRSLLR